MIFKPEMVEKILAGEKTETRRPVKYEPDGRMIPCRYYPGGGPDGSYAVQPGRTKAGVARIRVLSVDREILDQMEHGKALREGFTGTGEFKHYWKRLYGTWDGTQEVWAIRFELVPRKKGGASLLALGAGAL